METSLTPPNPNVPTPKEQPRRALAYEHLFPGNSFNSLPTFNPLNVPPLIKSMFWDYDTRDTRFGKAARAGVRFAERVFVVEVLFVVVVVLFTVFVPTTLWNKTVVYVWPVELVQV